MGPFLSPARPPPPAEAGYKVLDANDQLYDSENSIAACPTAWTGDNKPTITTNSSSQLVWTLTGLDNANMSIYGFQVRRCVGGAGAGAGGEAKSTAVPLCRKLCVKIG